MLIYFLAFNELPKINVIFSDKTEAQPVFPIKTDEFIAVLQLSQTS